MGMEICFDISWIRDEVDKFSASLWQIVHLGSFTDNQSPLLQTLILLIFREVSRQGARE